MNDDAPFVASAKWFLDRAMVTGRYSAGLIREFDAHVDNGTANIFPIFNEIGALEGAETAKPSRTKPASEFTGRWLQGLWHKHYTQASFMAENLSLHWQQPDRLRRMVTDCLGGRELPTEQRAAEQLSREVSQRFVHDAYLERGSNSKLTGEWIVFAKQDDVAYYLTMGTHGDDDAIWRRCKACAAEFPCLQVLQEDR